MIKKRKGSLLRPGQRGTCGWTGDRNSQAFLILLRLCQKK